MQSPDPVPAPRHPGRPARSRREQLDREAILAAAHGLVERHGLDGLRMRGLADELGVSAMAVYHYFPNKKALLYEMVQDVFRQVEELFPAPAGDFDDWIVECALITRRVWLEHLALVNLSMAVRQADGALIDSTRAMAFGMELAGFPDVPLAAGALQNFLLGSIATWTNRRISSEYFGLDPDDVLGEVERLLDETDASPNHRGLLVNRFDRGDDANFEPALRALLRGLRTAEPS